MYTISAQLYDLIYLGVKDYRAEARAIHEWLRKTCPSAKTVLDVACGTGEHAKHLSTEFGYEVDGLDITPDFADTASNKNPEGRFVTADMTGFDMGKTYDVVMCMFGSIGHLLSEDDTIRALVCFRRHLSQGGMVLVEPWLTPDKWHPTKVEASVFEKDGTTVCRMNTNSQEGRVACCDLHFLVGTLQGVRYVRELHKLLLLTVDDMKDCFAKAGFQVEYCEEGLRSAVRRGLYVATKK